MTSLPCSLSTRTVSAIIASASFSGTLSTSVTCSRQLLPKKVQTDVFASSSARTPASSPTGTCARRVEPNAAILACVSFSLRISLKNSMSRGFEAAKPPSM